MATENQQALDLDTTPTPPATSGDSSLELAGPLGDVARRILSHAKVEEDGERPEDAISERRRKTWDRLIDSIGARYAECRLSSFEISGEKAGKQRVAVDRLTLLAKNIEDHLAAGGNMLLFGPPGTGKDHLLVAMLRVAVSRDVRPQWINGQDLFGSFRDAIDDERKTERATIDSFASPNLLAISDPVPPKGEVREYGATMLYRIIDARYRRLKSTWVTVNALKRDELIEQLSAPVFDRLMDNCIAVECNWPSYRATRRPEWL